MKELKVTYKDVTKEVEVSNEVYEIIVEQFAKPKTVWDLKEGGVCWYWNYLLNKPTQDEMLGAHLSNWIANKRDAGEIFLTEEECRFDHDRDVAITKMQKWKDENDTFDDIDWKDFKQHKYEIQYNHKSKNFYVNYYWEFQTLPTKWYFSSEEKADEFIELFGEDYKKYYLGI